MEEGPEEGIDNEADDDFEDAHLGFSHLSVVVAGGKVLEAGDGDAKGGEDADAKGENIEDDGEDMKNAVAGIANLGAANGLALFVSEGGDAAIGIRDASVADDIGFDVAIRAAGGVYGGIVIAYGK